MLLGEFPTGRLFFLDMLAGMYVYVTGVYVYVTGVYACYWYM